MKLRLTVKKRGLVMCLLLCLLTHLYIGTALVPRCLKVAVENVVTESCVQWTTQRFGILCEHNCTPILKNDIIYPKNRTQNFNLASVHSPVVWFDVLFLVQHSAFILRVKILCIIL